MVEFPLEEFHKRRILYAVNRDFLWPLGLALTVQGKHPEDGNVFGEYERLFVSQWDYEDGHREAIEDPEADYDIEFKQWVAERRAQMPEADQAILDARHP